jgi:hypothetical protein
MGKLSGRVHITRERKRRVVRFARPGVERLEDRTLLATSSLVFAGADGNLLYKPDGQGNRIEDFSNVGYQGGTVALPDTSGGVGVPVKVTLGPASGDQTSRIQTAINQVSALPLDANGFRGALLLSAGEYPISGQLHITASGVVLKGANWGTTTGTRLRATGTGQRALIDIKGSGSRQKVSGTEHNLIDKYVPVGAISFRVDDTTGLSVGDTVVVHRPSTTNWIHDLKMDQIPPRSDGGPVVQWAAGKFDINWDRIITRIEGNLITVDAPITTALDRNYGGATIYKYQWPGRIENVGVENMLGRSDYTSSTDENHSWTFVSLDAVQNAWVRHVRGFSFASNVVNIQHNAKWVTVEDCQMIDPVSKITGGRRYSFNVDGQLNLVRNSVARNGRHDFVQGSLVAGPNVFVDDSSTKAHAESGPHQRWASGTLFDNINIAGGRLQARNAGNEGTGHGWNGANMVYWNSKGDNYLVQNPPTAHNWAIGGTGSSHTGNGVYDSWGTNVEPRSLYYAQLQERLNNPGMQRRQYTLGDMDNFTPGDDEDQPYVDPDWYNTVSQALGPGQTIAGFDDKTRNTLIPFTFQFALDSGDVVVGASLRLGLRSNGGDLTSDRIYLGSMDTSYLLGDDLGWLPLATSSTTGLVLDLSTLLDPLQNGTFNVMVGSHVGVGWAVLDLQVVPGSPAPRPPAPGAAAPDDSSDVLPGQETIVPFWQPVSTNLAFTTPRPGGFNDAQSGSTPQQMVPGGMVSSLANNAGLAEALRFHGKHKDSSPWALDEVFAEEGRGAREFVPDR